MNRPSHDNGRALNGAQLGPLVPRAGSRRPPSVGADDRVVSGDVDTAVEYAGFYYCDLAFDAVGLSDAALGIQRTRVEFSPAGYKNSLERALVRAFGRENITRGNRALHIRNRSTTLPADVVPCVSYRRHDAIGGYSDGIKLFPDSGSPITDWPQQA